MRVTLELWVDAPEGVLPVLVPRVGEPVTPGADGVDVAIEVKPGGDLGGPWVNGTKGQRFVYAGLSNGDGGWLRRWKWREEQIREALRGGGDIRVTLLLGAAVTPEMRVAGRG